MPRKILIRSDRFPYHITARVNNKEPFHLNLKDVWKMASEELFQLHFLYEFEVQAFVLMPNHFHLIATTPSKDLGTIMRDFLSKLTKRINYASGRTGRVFGERYFWSIITSTRYYGHALKYVYRNPVRANLCSRAEEYEFSTLSGLAGQTHLPFPVFLSRIGVEINIPSTEDSDWLDWLNRPFPNETEKLIQKSLLKKEIHYLINRNSRGPQLELERLL